MSLRHFDILILFLLVLIAFAGSGCTAPVQAVSPTDSAELEIYELSQVERINATEAIIRKSADATSPEIARLPFGTVVVIVARQGNWKKVEALQQTSSEGWILVDFLTRTTIAPAIVNVSVLNVRTGPGTLFNQLSVLRRSDALYVIGQAYSCTWLRVITPDQTEGWVAAEYVRLDAGCDKIPQSNIPFTLPTITPTLEDVALTATTTSVSSVDEILTPADVPTRDIPQAKTSTPSSASTLEVVTKTPTPTPTLLNPPTPSPPILVLPAGGIGTLPKVGEPVVFIVSFNIDCALGEAVYSWNFGDGATSTGSAVVSHIYTFPGVYLVRVSASTPCRTSSASLAITVVDSQTPTETPTLFLTDAPTLTTTVTLTPANTPTLTNTPTPTLTPTSTATETPTPTPRFQPEVRVRHGKQSYTEEQVKQSYELDYIPPFIFGEGTQIMHAHLVEMERHLDNSVELKGGHLIAGIPFHVNDDGSVDEIVFQVPGSSIILLQIGDQEGRHFDVSRYIPVPYVMADGHVVVYAYRTPGGIWHFELTGDFDMSRSRDLLYMAEVASQHLAREIGGTVMENSVGRTLARQARFGLWQRPDVEQPDGPWASQYMAAQCGQRMYYDANVTPRFVQVTGPASFVDLRTEEHFWHALRTLPAPPNLQAKYAAWYCANVKNGWRAPQPTP